MKPIDSLIRTSLTAELRPVVTALHISFEKRAAFHDEVQMFTLCLQQAEILERVAPDGDEIRERARRDGAELACHAQYFSVDEGGRGEYRVRRLHARTNLELLGLMLVQLAE